MHTQKLDTSEKMIPFSINEDNTIAIIIVYKDLFEKKCILHIANTLTPKYYVSISSETDNNILITITSKNGSEISEFIIRQFMNEMIEYQTWIDLNREFGYIRDLIVEQAFSSTK